MTTLIITLILHYTVNLEFTNRVDCLAAFEQIDQQAIPLIERMECVTEKPRLGPLGPRG